MNVRLGWGPNTPPTTTASPSSSVPSLALNPDTPQRLVSGREPGPQYFTSTPSPNDVKIIFNDWPYSGMTFIIRLSQRIHEKIQVPPEISHYLVWSRLPIVHSALVHPSVKSQIDRDGLWGFTGGSHDNNVADDGMYTDVAPGTSPSARSHILAASHHVHQFVLARWPEDEWEVAWFVNPPVCHTTQQDFCFVTFHLTSRGCNQ